MLTASVPYIRSSMWHGSTALSATGRPHVEPTRGMRRCVGSLIGHERDIRQQCTTRLTDRRGSGVPASSTARHVLHRGRPDSATAATSVVRGDYGWHRPVVHRSRFGEGSTAGPRPRASLVVAAPVGERERWISVAGPATVESDGVRALAERLAARYWDLGDPGRARDLKGLLAQDQVRIVVHPESIQRFSF